MVPVGSVKFRTVPENRQEYSRSFLSVFLQPTGLVHITVGLIKTDGNDKNCQELS
jgi:hypothetical protein